MSRARIWGGAENWVDLVTKQDVKIALSPQEQTGLEIKLTYTGPLMAPVKAGEKVGAVRFLVNGNAIAEIPVETASAVAADQSMWSKALDSLLIVIFGG